MLSYSKLQLVVNNRWNAMKDKASIVSINLSNQRIGMLKRISISIERETLDLRCGTRRHAPNTKRDLIKRGKQYLWQLSDPILIA